VPVDVDDAQAAVAEQAADHGALGKFLETSHDTDTFQRPGSRTGAWLRPIVEFLS
jgi:hypothetical protein